jgi:hypothetical protein
VPRRANNQKLPKKVLPVMEPSGFLNLWKMPLSTLTLVIEKISIFGKLPPLEQFIYLDCKKITLLRRLQTRYF